MPRQISARVSADPAMMGAVAEGAFQMVHTAIDFAAPEGFIPRFSGAVR